MTKTRIMGLLLASFVGSTCFSLQSYASSLYLIDGTGTGSSDSSFSKIAQFDGPASLTLGYSIVLNGDSLQSGTADLTSTSYTYNGTLVTQDYTHEPAVTVTSVVAVGGNVESFTFSATGWTGAGPNHRAAESVTGTFDITTGVFTYDAVYGSSKHPTITADYDFTGTVSSITGGTGATPLPASLPLFAGGLGALGLFGWRRKRKAAALIKA